MKRSQSSFTVEHIGGNQFAGLAEAQRAALPMLAADLATILRTMIARGDLVIESGRVTVPKSSQQ